jgi:hypothetical protein
LEQQHRRCRRAGPLAHGSLRSNNIGDAGAWDVGAALQVNTTLTTLK